MPDWTAADLPSFTGRTVVVTGANAGLGEVTARELAHRGAHVILAVRNTDKGEAAAGRMTGDVEVRHLDLQDLSSVRSFADGVDAVDILVNNAGIMDNFVPIGELTDELWERILSVNLGSQMRAMRAAVRIFQDKEQGVIINLTSAAGLFGSRAGVAYTASKHGVVGMTKNVAFQYAHHGIRCNAIAPGGVETNIGSTMNAPSDFGAERVMSGANNAPRTGQSEEVAAVALFLASDAASLVNGTVITADAGWMAY